MARKSRTTRTTSRTRVEALALAIMSTRTSDIIMSHRFPPKTHLDMVWECHGCGENFFEVRLNGSPSVRTMDATEASEEYLRLMGRYDSGVAGQARQG